MSARRVTRYWRMWISNQPVWCISANRWARRSLPSWPRNIDTLQRIPRIHTPTFVIAGDEDQIVPISQSRRVFEAANEPKSLLVIPHAEHNDEVLTTGRTMIEGMLRFLQHLR